MENNDSTTQQTPPPSQIFPPPEQPTQPVQPAQTDQEAQTPPPANEPPPPKKHKVLKIIAIIFGIIVLIIVGAVGFIAYNLQSKGLTIDKVAPKAIPTSTFTQSTNTTNNYKNNAYKFSMPYANDLKIKESPYGFGVTSIEMRAADTPKEYGPDFQILIFPKAIGEQIGQDFNKYYESVENTTQEIKDPTGSTVKFTKVKNRTVNNLRAFEFSSIAVPAEDDVEPEIGVYIELGTDTMVISTPESNKEELEKMLADFHYPLK